MDVVSGMALGEGTIVKTFSMGTIHRARIRSSKNTRANLEGYKL